MNVRGEQPFARTLIFDCFRSQLSDSFAFVVKALVYLAKIVSDIYVLLSIVTGNEFIKKVKKLAKVKGKTISIDKSRGKGSHITLYYGENFTVVRNPKDELKTGTYKAMLKQLEIKEDEF